MKQTPELKVRDKNGLPLREGDVVIGYLGWTSGYKKVNYPETVRELLRIRWNMYDEKYDLKPLGIVFEDYKYFKSNKYRTILHYLGVDPIRKYGVWGCAIGGTRRDDMRDLSIEKVDINNYLYYKHYRARFLYNAREEVIKSDTPILKQVNDKTDELISWFNGLIAKIRSENIEKLMKLEK